MGERLPSSSGPASNPAVIQLESSGFCLGHPGSWKTHSTPGKDIQAQSDQALKVTTIFSFQPPSSDPIRAF